MLKKIAFLACAAFVLTACKVELDLQNPSANKPEDIRKYFEGLEPPVAMSNDQFVSYVKQSTANLERDTTNMSLFLACSKDYINTPNAKGNTALSMAVNKRNLVVTKWLLDRGADISIKSAQLGLSPLEDAATRQDSLSEPIFKLLVEAQKQRDPELQSIGAALHLAATYGANENVKVLVEGGANPNAKNMDKKTPLHEAAREGKKAVVEYLISLGKNKIDINATDGDGYTPVDWAEASGEGSTFPEIGKILHKAGAKHTAAWKAAQ
ncbi:hypothetical protein AGMMS49938_08370 [Fibrobacterales bacterium]|nr:hypothetical protein AGMMS49938_08370 [Fibrobacterales bacterium]